jgi:hypothetical protein
MPALTMSNSGETPMSAFVRRLAFPLSVAITGLIAGCHTTPKPTNQFEDEGTKGSVAVVADNEVILETPHVTVVKGTIYITGVVRRRSAGSEEIPGRVDIEFLGPGGEYLDGLPALLTPRAIPVDPNTPATYSTSYGWLPPEGSTVRVHFVDHDTQVREDLEGNDFSYGGNHGAKAAGELSNSNPAKHSSNGGGSGFGGGFGSHKF